MICIVHHVGGYFDDDYDDVKEFNYDDDEDDCDDDMYDDNDEWRDALQLLAFSWNSLDAKPCLEFTIFTILIL